MSYIDPLPSLMGKCGCKPDPFDVDALITVDGKQTVVAKCNHVAGRWEITPEGQKLIDKLPPVEVAVRSE